MINNTKKLYWAVSKWRDPRKRPSMFVWARALSRSALGSEISCDTPFLFICGLHRSGTSILHETLRSHPSIVGLEHTGVPEDEGQHLQTVMNRDLMEGGPGSFAFHPEAHLTEASQLNSEENRTMLRKQWARFFPISGSICVEKSPPNLLRSRFLQEVFPNSYFLFVSRHPVPTSIATKRFAQVAHDLTFEQLINHWVEAHKIAIEDRAHLRRSRFIRYEDFVSNSIQVSTEIFRWLGLDDFDVSSETRDFNKKYFDQWEKLSAEERQQAQKYDKSLEKFGYSLSSPYIRDNFPLEGSSTFSVA